MSSTAMAPAPGLDWRRLTRRLARQRNVVIGGTIGSGILRNPSVVAAGFIDPKLIVLAWLAGGLFVAIDAMPTVELGAAIPFAGVGCAIRFEMLSRIAETRGGDPFDAASLIRALDASE